LQLFEKLSLRVPDDEASFGKIDCNAYRGTLSLSLSLSAMRLCSSSCFDTSRSVVAALGCLLCIHISIAGVCERFEARRFPTIHLIKDGLVYTFPQNHERTVLAPPYLWPSLLSLSLSI
jgi:hypothetical protein